VDEDSYCLTFEEWDPSTNTDSSQTLVEMIVNSSDLCTTGFDLTEVIPLQLEMVVRGFSLRSITCQKKKCTYVHFCLCMYTLNLSGVGESDGVSCLFFSLYGTELKKDEVRGETKSR
jgi:hypothetical protein